MAPATTLPTVQELNRLIGRAYERDHNGLAHLLRFAASDAAGPFIGKRAREVFMDMGALVHPPQRPDIRVRVPLDRTTPTD